MRAPLHLFSGDTTPLRGPSAYVTAAATVGAALLIQLSLDSLAYRIPFLPFFGAIALSAWLGGWGPGLFTTLLSAIAATYFFLPPYGSLALDDPQVVLMLAAFLVVAIVINALSYLRTAAGRAVRQERATLAATLTSLGDAVLATDTQALVTFMNPVAESLTGWTQAEAIGKHIDEVFRIVNEHTAEPAENPVYKALRLGRAVGLANHTVLIARDGTQRPLDDSAAPIQDDKGQVTGVVLVFRDVTDRRGTERLAADLLLQVQRQRKRMEDIVSTTPGIVWEAWGNPNTAEQRIDFVSDYVEPMLGYTRHEWLSTPNFWLAIVHPDDKEEAGRVASEHFTSGTGGSNRFRWVAKDGRVLWVEANSVVIKDEQGTPIGMRGVTIDVSERKRLEDQARAQSDLIQSDYRRLLSLIATMDIGVALVDRDKRFVLANDAWLEMSGYSRQEVVGKLYRDFSKSAQTGLWEGFLDRALAGEPLHFHDIFLKNVHRPGGTHVDTSFMPLADDAGNINAVLNVSIDVSETVTTRTRLEEQRATLTSMVEELPIGLALFDAEMHLLNLNAQWARMVNVDPSSIGRLLYEIAPTTLERKVFYERALAGEAVDLADVPYRIAGDERTYYRDIHLRPVRDHEGRVTGMLNAVIDVTERHELDEQKDALLALASHELKTPITTIKGYSQLGLRAAGSNASERLVRTLRTIDEQADRLTRLINEMLEVARIQSDTLPLHQGIFDMGDLVKQSAAAAQLTAPEFSVRLHLSEEPLLVLGDQQRMEQVITNLMQNAIKYSGSSRVIEISCGRSEDDKSVVTSVRDYGIGIPADQREKVFGRFFRARNVSSSGTAGMGLGLYISHEIVARHGGRLWVDSKEGEGSTFTFTLPVAEAAREQSAGPDDAPELLKGSSPS